MKPISGIWVLVAKVDSLLLLCQIFSIILFHDKWHFKILPSKSYKLRGLRSASFAFNTDYLTSVLQISIIKSKGLHVCINILSLR